MIDWNYDVDNIPHNELLVVAVVNEEPAVARVGDDDFIVSADSRVDGVDAKHIECFILLK